MADNGTKKWSDAERDNFVHQVIGQFIAGGAKLDLNKLSFPGRTKKALENQWTYLRQKSMAAVGVDKATKSGSVPSTPAKKGVATPGSKKRDAQAAGLTDGEDGDGAPTTPTPRAQKTPKKAKRVKNAQANVKDETDETDEIDVNTPVFKFEPIFDEGVH
ncbi:hypothetical protein F5Y08DRAFT_315115 [Xylaria arbuscula]|nr:hypothetical protein F5Y08DRAFT_315115 [Xylaria arbuscula]